MKREFVLLEVTGKCCSSPSDLASSNFTGTHAQLNLQLSLAVVPVIHAVAIIQDVLHPIFELLELAVARTPTQQKMVPTFPIRNAPKGSGGLAMYLRDLPSKAVAKLIHAMASAVQLALFNQQLSSRYLRSFHPLQRPLQALHPLHQRRRPLQLQYQTTLTLVRMLEQSLEVLVEVLRYSSSVWRSCGSAGDDDKRSLLWQRIQQMLLDNLQSTSRSHTSQVSRLWGNVLSSC